MSKPISYFARLRDKKVRSAWRRKPVAARVQDATRSESHGAPDEQPSKPAVARSAPAFEL